MTTAEDAIRNYFLFKRDPKQLRDEAKIAQAKEALASTNDPIARIRARQAAKNAETVDGETYRLAFIEHVGVWAKENGVGADVLLAEGAASADLAAAGLKSGAGAAGRKRRRAVPIDTIIAKAITYTAPFTKRQLMQDTDSSTAATKKAIDQMLSNNQLKAYPPDPNYSGRGRAPERFERV